MGIKSLVASRVSRVSGGLVLILSVAFSGYSWVQTSLKNARIATTNSRLTRIGLALRNYHDEHRRFPPRRRKRSGFDWTSTVSTCWLRQKS